MYLNALLFLYFNSIIYYNWAMQKVVGVRRNSLAAKAGIVKGDTILSINGDEFNDILDLIYAESGDELSIILKDPNKVVKIAKDAYQPLGLIFNEDIELKPKHCANKCLFCFVDQLPNGMRDTLYIKDDDYRLSFSTGSYVTLTNLKDKDVERIINYRLSPLYISVHAYDPGIRVKLTGNPNSANMFEIINKLAANGIIMHTQIVLCPDLNGGKVLEETLRELYKLYPAVATVAVVPVGLTRWREGLYPLKPVTAEDAAVTIDITEAIDADARKQAERGFAWCSDEMYIKAGRELPEYGKYGDFMQIENGVGMVRTFLDGISGKKGKGGEYHLVTGASFYPILKDTAAELEITSGAKLTVHRINNKFFGESVTVAGLMTAGDIIEQLGAAVSGGIVILPGCVLKEFEDVFLDGVTVQEASKRLNAKLLFAADGAELEDIICGEVK